MTFLDLLRERPMRPGLLDNAAPEIAALVEAARGVVAAWHREMKAHDSPGMARMLVEIGAVDRALSRLDAKVAS